MGILRQRHVVAGNLGKIQSNKKESPSGLRVRKEANRFVLSGTLCDDAVDGVEDSVNG
jgi:hypothetical protein